MPERPPCRGSGALPMAVLSFVSLLGCGTGSASSSQGQPPEGFAVQTLIDGPDGRTAYVHRIDDLEEPALDIGAALEVAGNGRVYARAGGLWSGSGESPEITPLTMTPDGRLRPDTTRRLSLQGLGFAQAPFAHVFLEDGRAYLFGETAAIWDPEAMVLEGEISLSTAMKGGRLPDAGLGVERAGRAFVPVTYEPFPNVDSAVHVLVVDTLLDEVVGVIEDSRCHSTGSVELAEDGTIYVTGTNGYVLPRFGTAEAPSTCILRILPGESDFDPSWSIAIRDVTEGRDATGFRYIANGVGLLFVFHRDALSDASATDLRTYYEALASRWWRIDLNAARAAPVDGIGFVASGSGISSFIGGERTWVAAPTTFPASENQFFEVGPTGTAAPRLTFTGRGLIWPL